MFRQESGPEQRVTVAFGCLVVMSSEVYVMERRTNKWTPPQNPPFIFLQQLPNNMVHVREEKYLHTFRRCACSLKSAKRYALRLEDPVFLAAEWHHPYPPFCDSARLWDCHQFDLSPSLSLPPSQLTEIMQLMNAYFSAIHRQRGKGEDADITEVGFRHLRPAPTPTLLELPSHPVWGGPVP